VVAQPGYHHDFGKLKGPLFHYGGPYHFKVPFSIAGSKGSRGGGSTTNGGGGSTGGGSTAGGGGTVTAPQPAPQPRGIIRVAPAAARSPAHPAGLWLLIPAGLLAIAAVAAVVFEPRQRRETIAS
jgi:hypothetical protein